MKRIGLAFAVVVAATLSACAGVEVQKPIYPTARPAPQPPPPPPTPLDEFAWSTARGSNGLAAVVSYRPRSSERWSCAGSSVGLTPETSYSRNRIQTLYGAIERTIQTVAEVRARSAANAGLDYGQFVRSTTCDAKDSFVFQGLPDGAWFLIVRVRPISTAGEPTGEGVVIMQRIELRGGGTRQISLPTAQPAAASARRPAPRVN
jgi:hypothetical protein